MPEEDRDLITRIIEASPVGIAVVDREGQITYANTQAERILGLTKDKITQRTYNAPDWRITDHNGNPFPDEKLPFRRVKATQKAVYDVRHAVTWPDGRRVLLSINAAPLLDKSGRFDGVVASFEDVTARVKTEEKLHRATRALKALSCCNQAVIRAQDEQELLQQVCNCIVEKAEYRLAWVGHAEHDRKKTVRPVAQAGYEEGYLDTVNITWADTKRGQGPTGTAIRTGNPVICRDVLTNPQYASWRNEAAKRGYASSIALPLAHEGQVFGALTIYARMPDAFDSEETGSLTTLANDLAFGIATLRMREQLRESEERYHHFVERANDGIAVIQDQKIQYVNQRLVEMLGASSKELFDKPFLDWIAPAEVETILERWRKRAAGETIPPNYETVLQRKDGSKIHAELNVSIFTYQTKPAILAVVRDITERLQTEEALRQSEVKLRLIFESVADGIVVTDLEGNITQVNEAAVRLYGSESKEELLSRSAFEVISNRDHYRAMENFKKTLLEGYSGVIEYMLLKKDGSEYPAQLSAALMKDEAGKPMGFVAIIEDITERKQAEDRLRKTLAGTIEVIGLTTERRDPYTAGHQKRVTQLACAIAREMRLSEEQIEAIRIAGLVHDIGKMAVPAEILSKPSELTEAEFSLIKVHPQVAYDILKTVEFPWSIPQIVFQHHERLDGLGYPQGLKDDEILLEARILAVADVVEAMASHRPYRPALGIEKALEEIAAESGTCYDRDVVNACLKVFSRGAFQFES